ncbi:protoporphyrinogen/coproporphyrinogen oxidase [Litoribacillus peritrichatus]|uniref:Amine oxidase domain-containing protein n=1 Tax=Litoribacillus peritrichatus TaxID=718191 RepID=A0ABP7MQD2_9GAMM
MPRSLKVAVIGAGASGVATAYYLKQAGYSRVTLFERDERIGGKCLTFKAGEHEFDLGANYITPYYKEVLKIAEQLSLKTKPAPQRKSFDLSTGNYLNTLRTTLMGKSKIEFGLASAKYLYLMFKYRKKIDTPGFAELEKCPELCHPFGKWLDINGMSILRQLFLIPVTIFGYGSLDDVPTPYVMKYMDAKNFILLAKVGAGLSKEWPRHFEDGYQGFLDAIIRSEQLDVRLNAHIVSIKRTPSVVVGLADGSLHEFDRIVLACPFEQVLPVLSDATKHERDLFSRIKYRDYYVTACDVEGMLDITTDELQLPPAKPLPGIGHPWGVVKFWKESDINLFFTVADKDGLKDAFNATSRTNSVEISPNVVEANIRADVKKMGGKFNGVVRQQLWTTFFPHVEAADLLDGYYKKLEAQQGTLNTYYVGALVALELVEPIFNYSKSLVSTHFSKVND